MEPTSRNRRGSIPVPPPAEMPVAEEVKMPVEAPLVEEESAPVQSKPSTEPATPNSEKVLKPVSKMGIKVVALRNGFWKNCRKNPGDEFYVPEMSKVGDWMKCLDASQEKQHQQLIKERKLAAAGN